MNRRLVACFVLAMLVGVVAELAGAGTNGAISARLTKTSFSASQAGSVSLVYSFSTSSTTFRYAVSRSTGSGWQVVSSITKKGSFRGSHTMTVTKLFAGHAVAAGSYRLVVSAGGTGRTLTFQVTAAAASFTPKIGAWSSTSLGGAFGGNGGAGNVTVKSVSFGVGPGAVTGFGYSYEWSCVMKVTGGFGGGPTSGNGSSSESTAAPIKNLQFSTPGATGAWTAGGAGTFQGTFDSATTAHGTATFGDYVNGSACFMNGMVNTGTFTWTAAWHG